MAWDVVLDGRRRHDLRVTLILDPAIGLICWAHYAPPINDMFRKSYRKLLRWNDELPFVKFAVSEDERPILTAELPPGAVDADALGLALARLLAVSDRLLDESADWIWLGGRRPAGYDDRPARHAALLDRYADRLAELRGAGLVIVRRLGPRRPRLRPRARPRGRAPGRPRGRGRDSRPDPRLERPLRRAARGAPRPRHRRSHGDEPPPRHGDAPLLLRPRLPRRPARHGELPPDRGRRLAERPRLADPGRVPHPRPDVRPADLRPEVGPLPADLRPARSRRCGEPGRPRRHRTRVVPGLGVCLGGHAGEHGQRRLPEGLQRPARGRRSSRPHDRRGGANDLRDRRPRPALDVLRLLRRRPGRGVRGIHGDRRGGGARGGADDPRLAGRSRVAGAGHPADGARPAAACTGSSACPGRATSRSSSRSRSAGPPVATRACSTRARAGSRSPTTPTPSSSSTRPPTPGSTAASSPTAGRTRRSRRTTPSRPAGSWARRSSSAS